MLTLFTDIGLVLLSLILLWKGSDLLVESSVKIANTLGISQLVIGLTIVAFGTSAPEFAVTISAAISGQADISVSNIIGSNIFNLGFILGAVAIFQSIESTRKLIFRDGLILILSTLAIIIFLWDRHFNRIEGIVLFLGLIVYNIILFVKKEDVELDVTLAAAGIWDWLKLLLSLGIIFVGSRLLIHGAVGIAEAAGISQMVIGLTIVAAGTSVPEFATSLVAAIKGQHGISAGNLMGSCIYNTLGVLGLAGTIRSMDVDPNIRFCSVTLFGLIFLVLIMLRIGWKLTKIEGIVLFSISLILFILFFI